MTQSKISSSLSSASSAASSAANSAASSASSALNSATAQASASAYPEYNGGLSTTTKVFSSLGVIFTFLLLAAAGLYFAGYADDVGEWFAKRYYKGKGIAQAKVLEHSGSEKLQSMARDSLKKNPVMGEEDVGHVGQVGGGLGRDTANTVNDGVGNASQRISGLTNL
ncbi:hypothetical protein HRR83_007476 [Exophiala dermatitidis]|uniref:Uncharacterized protein n=2 Tax=Exophiala dermatitidis TaxID=5970 RepID=H6C2H3_EXODN|nr:uncharacterized protein HMPREF1120_06754 [Exophiala dermatitidis NIH/UT8656]KAJ4508533.1 hypothetical protein HRR75_006354 [Exophiala dermatitidis]EHY58751.1 hypothetical protein HMPREF1120_06754 [Exophiala dermatitidis NIH/UT8656]KAJ4510450.1 hypothetical protein HRR74_006922 [Exophiala dermatitidis]KAJ4510616.1 hypothetical protein HRR73_006688 [Exophiala dermatitidis]KAJ4535060.1 hypothetical protein HRR76_006960 [Exophiala dermatitidis]